jgi:hypothetical protein
MDDCQMDAPAGDKPGIEAFDQLDYTLAHPRRVGDPLPGGTTAVALGISGV